jgi:hypothetical protein
MGVVSSSSFGSGWRRSSPPSLRRVALAVFFASVVGNTVLGLSALLVGEFSETHGRVLGTSLFVTVGILGALACAPAYERGRLAPIPMVGFATCPAAASLAIVSIWTGGNDQTLGKAVGTLAAVAAGCVLVSLLAYPELASRFRVVLTCAIVLAGLAVAMMIVALWFEPDTPLYARAFGVVGVLLAAFAVSVPVLSRIDHAGGRGDQPAGGEIAFCPYCGHAAVASDGAATCSACKRVFAVSQLPADPTR